MPRAGAMGCAERVGSLHGHREAAQRLGDAARKKVATMDDLLGGVAGDVRVAGCRPKRSVTARLSTSASALIAAVEVSRKPGRILVGSDTSAPEPPPLAAQIRKDQERTT